MSLNARVVHEMCAPISSVSSSMSSPVPGEMQNGPYFFSISLRVCRPSPARFGQSLAYNSIESNAGRARANVKRNLPDPHASGNREEKKSGRMHHEHHGGRFRAHKLSEQQLSGVRGKPEK